MGLMQTQLRRLVGLVLTLGLVLVAGFCQSQTVLSNSGPVLSLSLSISPIIPKSARGERNIILAAIDSAGLTNATLTLTSRYWSKPVTHAIPSLPKGKQSV